MHGGARREARRLYPADKASRRETPRRRRERRRGERERGRDRPETRRTPEVPCAVRFAAASGAEPSKPNRVAQDCDPKAYMYTPSGCMDARIGRVRRRAPLRGNEPHTDRQARSNSDKQTRPRGGCTSRRWPAREPRRTRRAGSRGAFPRAGQAPSPRRRS